MNPVGIYNNWNENSMSAGIVDVVKTNRVWSPVYNTCNTIIIVFIATLFHPALFGSSPADETTNCKTVHRLGLTIHFGSFTKPSDVYSKQANSREHMYRRSVILFDNVQ